MIVETARKPRKYELWRVNHAKARVGMVRRLLTIALSTNLFWGFAFFWTNKWE